jgi:hypothetical protein
MNNSAEKTMARMIENVLNIEAHSRAFGEFAEDAKKARTTAEKAINAATTATNWAKAMKHHPRWGKISKKHMDNINALNKLAAKKVAYYAAFAKHNSRKAAVKEERDLQ